MCEQCKDLQSQIDQYTRLLKRGFDELTEERMRAVLEELEAQKNELHLAQPTQ